MSDTTRLIFNGYSANFGLVGKKESFLLASLDAMNYGVQLERRGMFIPVFTEGINGTQCILNWTSHVVAEAL